MVDYRHLSPQQRLAISRRTLVATLRHDAQQGQRNDQPLRLLGDLPWDAVAAKLAHRWWNRHPVHVTARLTSPVLTHYARKQPIRLVAAAAAVGALTVIIKPWRLVSRRTMVKTLTNNSRLANMVSALKSHSRKESK